MTAQAAVEALTDWFGTREFMIRDMSPDRVEEFLTLGGLLHLSDSPKISQRAQIGRWIKERAEWNFSASGKTIRLIVVDNGDRSRAATYRCDVRMGVR